VSPLGPRGTGIRMAALACGAGHPSTLAGSRRSRCAAHLGRFRAPPGTPGLLSRMVAVPVCHRARLRGDRAVAVELPCLVRVGTDPRMAGLLHDAAAAATDQRRDGVANRRRLAEARTRTRSFSPSYPTAPAPAPGGRAPRVFHGASPSWSTSLR